MLRRLARRLAMRSVAEMPLPEISPPCEKNACFGFNWTIFLPRSDSAKASRSGHFLICFSQENEKTTDQRPSQFQDDRPSGSTTE
jgi:hypothetical protein